MKKIKLNIAIWIGVIIGGIYALIPFIAAISWGSAGGDPGPYWLYMNPLFMPLALTSFLIAFIIALILSPLSLLGISIDHSSLGIPAQIINLLLWMFGGGLIGWRLKRRKKT